MAAVKAIELASVIYCTFENDRGSIIDCQYPDGYISDEQFKRIAHAAIPRANLANQPITVEDFGHYVIGFPQRIEGTQYSRNTFLFNLCFVVRPSSQQCHQNDLTGQTFSLGIKGVCSGLRPAIHAAYELTVRKANRYLAYMEVNSSVLSQETVKRPADGSPDGESVIHRFLRQMWTDLRQKGLCVTGVGDDLPPLYLIITPRMVNTSISSCFTPSEDELPTLEMPKTSDFLPLGGTDVWSRVPSAFSDVSSANAISSITNATVFVCVRPLLTSANNRVAFALDERQSSSLSSSSFRDCRGSRFWETRDLASSRLLPLVNGERSVAELARLAMIDVNITRLCMAQLSALSVVRVVSSPIFAHPTSCTSEAGTAELFSVPGYMGLPRMLSLPSDGVLREACFESVLTPATKSNLHKFSKEELIFTILKVYSKVCASPYLSLAFLLASTQSFADVIAPPAAVAHIAPNSATPQTTPPSLLPSIDLLHLIQFGEVNNLIHRLHCFPISEAPSGVRDESSLTERLWTDMRSSLMDGVQSVDDLVFIASSKTVSEASRASGACPRAWNPKRFSNLPDAVVAFTSRLLVEEAKGGSTAARGTLDLSASDTNGLDSHVQNDLPIGLEAYNGALQRSVGAGEHETALQTLTRVRKDKLYTLWH